MVTLSYQRWGRNTSIENIDVTPVPGAMFTTFIPGPPHWGNSDPSYTLFPPTVVCANYSLTFDHAAFDKGGDSLEYSLCEAFGGAGPNTVIVGPDTTFDCPTCQLPNPATPPYTSVAYVGPYSSSNPMGGSPQMAIAGASGLLTGTPVNLGQFVVAVCVSEYRDGVLLSTYRREFQFNVTECVQSVQAFAQPSITQCDDYTVAFNDSSTGGFAYLWFGVTGSGATTAQHDPTFTYAEGGEYNGLFVVNPNTLCSDTAVLVTISNTNEYTVSSETRFTWALPRP